MGGGPRGLDAAALIHRDVDDDCPLAHAGEHGARHQVWRPPAGNEHRADDQIGVEDDLLDIVFVARPRAQAAVVDVVQVDQPLVVHVQHGHLGAHANGNLGGIGAHAAAAEDGHTGRRHARHAAHEDAAPALGFLQIERADLRRHAARHLAHGLEQRQLAVGRLHSLVSEPRDALFQQLVGETPIRSEMQIGEEQQVTAQVLIFGLDGFLDLDDQLGSPGAGGFGHDLAACGAIFVVRDGAAQAGAAFHQHAMAAAGQGLDRTGRQANPAFTVFDLFGQTDQHNLASFGPARTG